MEKNIDSQKNADGTNLEKNVDSANKAGEAEDEKKFSQAELDEFLKLRVSRETAKAEKALREKLKEKEIENKKKSFEQLDAEEKEKKLHELELEQLKSENESLKQKQKDFEAEKTKSSILNAYAKDELPCVKEFTDSGIIDLIATVEDNEKAMQIYNGIKNLITSIESKYRKDSLKQQSPNGGTDKVITTSNPFKENNFTEMNKVTIEDRAKAYTLAKEAGVADIYFPNGK